ncbi:MAG: dinitrogenase iron-molybdenum cofactor biosynthesis protein [Clostridia bacterium]|nr:dinitrogenase iron-molybdenum cofactor biosynthesis protein [Clostridia bacterium]
MRIAIPVEGEQVYTHFGHASAFKIYELIEGEHIRSQVVEPGQHGHSAIAAFLRALKVQAVLCGNMGEGAQLPMAETGIRVFGGVSGDADTALIRLLTGQINESAQGGCGCHHHEGGCHHHGEGCDCGGDCASDCHLCG